MKSQIMHNQLVKFYREWTRQGDVFDEDGEDGPELWDFEDTYVRENPAFGPVIQASTPEDRRRAFDAVQLESCRLSVRELLAADVLKFFDVTCLNDLDGDGGVSATVLRRLKQVAQDAGVRLQDLLVLAPANDPFNCGGPAQVEQAEWFATVWAEYMAGKHGHLRKCHYKLISQPEPILKPDGTPYLNTEEEQKNVGSILPQNCSDFLKNHFHFYSRPILSRRRLIGLLQPLGVQY